MALLKQCLHPFGVSEWICSHNSDISTLIEKHVNKECKKEKQKVLSSSTLVIINKPKRAQAFSTARISSALFLSLST